MSSENFWIFLLMVFSIAAIIFIVWIAVKYGTM